MNKSTPKGWDQSVELFLHINWQGISSPFPSSTQNLEASTIERLINLVTQS